MRVLLITDNHSFSGGGAEKYFFTLKEKLAQHNGIDVVSLGFGPHAVIEKNQIILKETSSPLLRFLWRLIFHPIKYRQLRKAIQQIQPDIIHLHNVKKYTPSLFRAIKNYPVAQTTHDFSLICPTSWNVHKNLRPCSTGLRWTCLHQHPIHYSLPVYTALLLSFFRIRHLVKKTVKHYLAPSPLLADYLKMNDFSKTTFLPLFLDPATPFTTAPDPNHFLFLGQFGKHKGIAILLDEFALAVKQNPRLKLTLAGEGKEEKRLRSKAAELHLDQHIEWIHWQNNPSQLYQNTGAVIFPSIGLESFGLVITEAMSHGRPVIGSNRGPTTQLIDHEKTGLLFDPLKKGELASCILKLASNPSFAQQLGQAGLEKIKRFPTDEEILGKLLKIYDEVKAGI